MFTRSTGYLIVPLWLAATGWLIYHDVVPGVTASAPPPVQANDWLRNVGRSQYRIQGALGEHLGTIWTTYPIVDDEAVIRDDLVILDRFPLAIAPLRVEVTSTFEGHGRLDEFKLELEGPFGGTPRVLKLAGERFHSDFAFTLTIGLQETSFKVPLTDGGMIAGAFNPFGQIEDIEVGQRWRVQVFNPVAAMTGVGERFTPVLVEVTGRQKMDVAGKGVECLVVQSPNVKAWVDPEGVVQRQEITLPGLGMIRMVREATFDERAFAAAKLHLVHHEVKDD